MNDNNETPIFDSELAKMELNSKYGKYSETDSVRPSNVPTPKVVAATVGAGVGSALATILVWVLNVATGVDVPEAVELASGVVLTAGLAFIGGFWKKG